LGQFVEHLVCIPKIKGLRTLLKNAQPPAKTNKNQHRIKGHNPREDLCLLIEQKIKQFGGFFGEIGFRVGWGQNGKSEILGGRRWVGTVENGRR
jgi:hypothetical protein